MAAAKSKSKSMKNATSKVKKATSSSSNQEREQDQEDILQAIDAISDESDEDAGQAIEDASDSDEDRWDQDALALRKMISDGKFDDLLKTHDEKKKGKQDCSSDDDVEEEELESDESEKDDSEEKNDNDAEKDSESSDEEEEQQMSHLQDTRATALAVAIQSSDRHLPFAETFTIVPPTPLPFGPPKTSVAVGIDEEDAVDIHDDLKREVAFYDNALEAVNIARGECEKAGIPFTRPDDFFAEMIKTDGKFKVLVT